MCRLLVCHSATQCHRIRPQLPSIIDHPRVRSSATTCASLEFQLKWGRIFHDGSLDKHEFEAFQGGADLIVRLLLRAKDLGENWDFLSSVRISCGYPTLRNIGYVNLSLLFRLSKRRVSSTGASECK